MRETRTYSWDFKAEALATYEVDGPAATARLYEMPLKTLKSWAQRLDIHTEAPTVDMTKAACALQAARREVVREKLLLRVEEMLDRMDGTQTVYIGAKGLAVTLDKPAASTCKDFAMTIGILLDKYRLEKGEATGREEVRHEFANLSDADLIREVEEITRAAAQ